MNTFFSVIFVLQIHNRIEMRKALCKQGNKKNMCYLWVLSFFLLLLQTFFIWFCDKHEEIVSESFSEGRGNETALSDL